jgi:hypothetical protein
MKVKDMIEELLLKNPEAEVRMADFAPVVLVVGSWDGESVFLSDEEDEIENEEGE